MGKSLSPGKYKKKKVSEVVIINTYKEEKTLTKISSLQNVITDPIIIFFNAELLTQGKQENILIGL